ncbi:unnamed protein product, partial [Owenia fusiformis]
YFETKTLPRLDIGFTNTGKGVVNATGELLFLDRGQNGAIQTVSIESQNRPGWYLRQRGFDFYLEELANATNVPRFEDDATFIMENDKWFPGYTIFQTFTYGDHYMAHDDEYSLKVKQYVDNDEFKDMTSFKLIL